ncbi:MAG: GNAT family N-acetyltransferase [Flavobacteriia bacterium]|nr:GNAT family N-acetyltransferase [Flavobacteriia bacterium]
MSFQIKPFDQLTLIEFHELIQLRNEVFVIEQNCVYQELDGKDIFSFHLIGKDENDLTICTCRILPEGISYPEVSIGRFVVKKNVRGKGVAEQMMKNCLDFIEKNFNEKAIRISAQCYTEKFYQKFAFVSTNKTYLEDGIPHVEMIRKN